MATMMSRSSIIVSLQLFVTRTGATFGNVEVTNQASPPYRNGISHVTLRSSSLIAKTSARWLALSHREPREQLQRISAQHCLVLGFIDRGCPPELARAGDREITAKVRKVRSEQDPIEPDGSAQHVDHRIAPRCRCVPVKAAESFRCSATRFPSGHHLHFVDDAEAAGEIRNRAARVRDDVFDIGGEREAV